MAGIQFVKHFGKVILEINIFDAISTLEAKEAYERAHKFVKMYRSKEPLYILHHIGDFTITKELIMYITPKFLEVKKKVRRRAFVVSSDHHEVFIRLFKETIGVNSNSEIFREYPKAVSYLLQGEEK